MLFFDTVGCRLNQSEIERMAREFRFAGPHLVGSMNEG
jgi:tRNA A37 methylthiotransferase MiaB